MRTLGFPAATIFVLVVGEGLLVSVVGGAVGAALARLIVNGETLGLTGGFIPAFGVNNGNVARRRRPERADRRARGGHPGDDGVAAEDRRRAAAGGVKTKLRLCGLASNYYGSDRQLQPALDDRPQGHGGDDRDGHRDGGRRLRDDDGDRAGLQRRAGRERLERERDPAAQGRDVRDRQRGAASAAAADRGAAAGGARQRRPRRWRRPSWSSSSRCRASPTTSRPTCRCAASGRSPSRSATR